MRVYISGPMTGKENFNLPYFAEVAKDLRAYLDYEVVSPHEVCLWDGCTAEKLNKSHTHDYREWITAGIAELLICDAIAMLPGWTLSRGSVIELNTAISCGIKIYALRAYEHTDRYLSFLKQTGSDVARYYLEPMDSKNG